MGAPLCRQIVLRPAEFLSVSRSAEAGSLGGFPWPREPRTGTGLTGHGWVAAEASNPPSLHIFGISSREIRSGIGQG